MAGYSLEQLQRTSQLQIQRMSQQQIMALQMLAMGSWELRDEIYRKAAENPALEIIRDPFADGTSSVKKTSPRVLSSTHLGTASGKGSEMSDNFQMMIESTPDSRETLQEHLLLQLNVMKLTGAERKLCKSLIFNLDSSGFHILAPVTLLDPSCPEQNEEMLERCIGYIRRMDPAGVCCTNIEESLAVQAEQKGCPSELTMFLLHGHLDMLVPPVPEKIHKKLLAFYESQKKLVFQQQPFGISRSSLNLRNIGMSLKYIQSLDPRPARDFDCAPTSQYIRPDVFISRESGFIDKDVPLKGLICDTADSFFRIALSNDVIPVIQIAPEFKDAVLESKIKKSDEKSFIKSSLHNAQTFIESLDFRGQTIVRTCSLLVSIQKDFFRLGPGHLVPLSQRKFAEIIGVHESTVSRMADSKFLHCAWGTFPIKYFFSTAIPASTAQEDIDDQPAVSSDTVKHEIIKILNEQPPGAKRLSDQKLADALADRGYKIARRTVAKYRTQLNIDSSYKRV